MNNPLNKMRITIACFLIIALSLSSCKAKQNATATADSTATTKGKTIGTVSHKYRTTGCATVILVTTSENNPMVLIPKDKLSEQLDKDGLEITFDYRTLRMPNPPGCNAGIPAELTNISKK